MAALRIKEVREPNSRTANSVCAADSLRCDVNMEGHATVIDEPAVRGGDDEGASPLLHLTAALASCQTVQVKKVAEAMRLEVGEVKVDATLDTGRGDGREKDALIIRFVGADMLITMQCNAAEKKIERLKRLAVDRCPVSALLEDAGIEPRIQWNIVPL